MRPVNISLVDNWLAELAISLTFWAPNAPFLLFKRTTIFRLISNSFFFVQNLKKTAITHVLFGLSGSTGAIYLSVPPPLTTM